MSHRDTPWPAGTPCWVDIAVPDVSAATAFYGDVIGWSFVDTGEEFGHYTIAQTDGRAAAAITPQQEGGQPPYWSTYLATQDTDATAKLITENGGTLLVEPMDVPGNGRFAIALDPTGGAFGIWQAAGMNGFTIANEPGSVTWNEARLTDLDAGKAFYAVVFGHTYQEIPAAPDDYATIQVGGEPVGGIVRGQEGVPSHWLTYFSVADVDAAVAAATRGGATVLMPAESTPFGRMSILTDPFGATFGVHRAPEDGTR